LVVHGKEYEILFDLTADPEETTNVFAQAGYEQIYAQARQRMDTWLKQEQLEVTFAPT
jgi:hypothetical protein